MQIQDKSIGTDTYTAHSKLYTMLGCRKAWLRTAAGLLSGAAPAEGGRALDLCCGTGDLAFHLCESNQFAVVVGVDFDRELLETAKIRAIAGEGRGQAAPIFLYAAMKPLPFADTELDVAGTAFGLGVVEDCEKALSEVYRVMRPGATFAMLEYCRPDSRWRKMLAYLQFALDTALFGHYEKARWRAHYESRKQEPTAQQYLELVEAAGFENVKMHRFVFGDAVLVWGVKPAASATSEV